MPPHAYAQHRHAEASPNVFANGTTPFRWRRWHWWSWANRGTSSGTPTGSALDFWYLARGANANARVVACEYRADHTYANCARVAIQPHISGQWADTQIKVECNQAHFSGEDVDIYVIPAGYPEAPVFIDTVTVA